MKGRGVGVALLALAACSAPDQQARVVAPAVATARVTAVDLEERIEATGELVARLHTDVAAEVEGRVTRILREEGDAVVEREVVFEIDPRRRELDLEAARARVAQARARLDRERRQAERIRQLFEREIGSQARLDEAETALALARADAEAELAALGVAKRALAHASVSAPFSGLVARRLVNVGQYVQEGTPLFELVSLDPIDVIFRLAEVDSGRVRIGQRVAVEVAPHPDRRFEAVVDVVSPTIDPDTRTLRVRATLPNANGSLRPGLFARADLGLSLRRGVAMVPEEAVLQRTDGAVVYRLREDSRVERRVVQIGSFHEGMVEIRAGVEPGDAIVTRGHAALVDGAAVRVPAPGGLPDVASGATAPEAQPL